MYASPGAAAHRPRSAVRRGSVQRVQRQIELQHVDAAARRECPTGAARMRARPALARAPDRVPRARATRCSWYSRRRGTDVADRGRWPTRSPDPRAPAARCPDRRCCSAAMRLRTASICAGLVGPRFEPPELRAVVGLRRRGRRSRPEVLAGHRTAGRSARSRPADRRWRISEPLRLARAQHTAAMPVTTSG